MSELPTIIENQNEISSYQDLVHLAFDFAEQSNAKNTRRTYDYGWKSFLNWCSKRSVDPYSTKKKEALVAFYVSEVASKDDLKVSSIMCYIAAIRYHYQKHDILINLQHPSINKVLQGIRRTCSRRPKRKEPILTEDLREMVQVIPTDREGTPYLVGIRDRALLLLGFAGAFRRSELVGLDMEDINFTRDGFVALIKRSKTDQEGEGVEKAIPYGAHSLTCPVRALKDWIDQSKISVGPIFRPINRHGQIRQSRLTSQSIALIIKRNPYLYEKESDFSGHSLRSGFITSAAKNNVPEDLIMKQSGHKSSNTVKIYIRRGKRFEENAASLVGL